MKRINRRMHLIFVVIIAFIVAASAIDERMDNQRAKRLEDTVNQLLQARTHLDSLYWNHLEECSFISRDDIKVGYNNYLQVVHVNGKGEIE